LLIKIGEGLRAVWQRSRFNPTGVSQPLHDLLLAVIWRVHLFAFSPIPTRRRMFSQPEGVRKRKIAREGLAIKAAAGVLALPYKLVPLQRRWQTASQ
jgi:hypothetical protein